jgi:very-short-patch-repair endonuclease
MSKEIELLIASKIDEYTNNTCRIIRNEVEPYVLFCASDIGKIIGVINLNDNLRYFDKDKCLIPSKTNGGIQQLTYITHTGLLKILTKSRKRCSQEFANAIGVDIKSVSFACIEASSIDCICKTFTGEEMIEQYRISNFIIDLYFPKYKLAIECDEKGHNNNKNIIKDAVREAYLKSFLACKFIRYKPYEKDFNIFDLLNEIFTHISKSKNI